MVSLNYKPGRADGQYHLFPPGSSREMGLTALCGVVASGTTPGKVNLSHYLVERGQSVSKFFGGSLCEKCREKIRQ